MSTSAVMVDDAQTEPGQEFVYRPVPPLVPVSAAFVLLSVTAFAWDVLVAVPLLGTILALLAWRQVARSDGAYSGEGIAKGVCLILPVMIVAAVGFHAYAFATEVPEGYQRVSFASDISNKGFIVKEGLPEVHPDVEKLSSQPIFLKGYMYPTKQTTDLKSFVLCKDSGDCCFGGQPKMTDMIYVEMTGDRTVDFRGGLVAVAGNFKASPTLDPTGLNPVYKLECDHFGGAKTTY